MTPITTRSIVSLIEGHSVYEDATGIIFLTATDAESAPCELSINIKSSDQSILSDNQISNTCYENNVTITALPEPNQRGPVGNIFYRKINFNKEYRIS
jgi:hypothetical protein